MRNIFKFLTHKKGNSYRMRSRRRGRRNKYDVIIREKLWKAFVGIISKCYVNIKSNNYIYMLFRKTEEISLKIEGMSNSAV